mmetsp:Transcript_37852/g.73948  ORF Transcript_37852/g.73948 Transcript_37852/m.73948 type:complete len:232 (+) Transcript_37852:91-786(+)|eukprot:CAMPEP_0173415374 /NCGR_PEP_ID=MMETSP1356-20130122/84826_1 /TAXON_ID=77927 ORGANISM="Hemiselmis virescens, Strain PCC157" /NCGR_SAMPLE_ID=MMETSP1356 /ASSEMBLY_ACC=CAM_ASM_000847 /LENGTH=231 /DNA_ID=CAMNT_0014377617 /DNA_START=90 /DNA_END=785 /DNA_ORIENTATION=-
MNAAQQQGDARAPGARSAVHGTGVQGQKLRWAIWARQQAMQEEPEEIVEAEPCAGALLRTRKPLRLRTGEVKLHSPVPGGQSLPCLLMLRAHHDRSRRLGFEDEAPHGLSDDEYLSEASTTSCSANRPAQREDSPASPGSPAKEPSPRRRRHHQLSKQAVEDLGEQHHHLAEQHGHGHANARPAGRRRPHHRPAARACGAGDVDSGEESGSHDVVDVATAISIRVGHAPAE